jgi:hypothetical protein
VSPAADTNIGGGLMVRDAAPHAAELGRGHTERVAQHPQRGVAVDIDLMGCAVDL